MTISAITASSLVADAKAIRAQNYIFDSFDRTEMSNLHNSTTTSGHRWQVESGYFGISGNQAYRTSSDGLSMAHIESYYSDFVMEVDLKYDTFSGFIFRMSNGNNFWFARIGTTDLAIWKNVASTPVAVGTPYSFTPVQGQNYKLKLVAKGNKISVYLDGIRRIEVTDSWNMYATKHGLTTRVANSNPRFDNFSISPIIGYDAIDSMSKPSGDTLFTTDTGLSWTALNGTFAYSTSGVKATSLVGTQSIAVVNTSSPDGTWRLRVNIGDDGGGTITRNAGIVFRVVDSGSFWLFRPHRTGATGSVQLVKYTAGSSATILDANITPNANTWYDLKIKAIGDRISVFMDNNFLGEVYDSSYKTATQHGFRIASTTTFDTILVDDFYSEKYSPLIAYDSFSRPNSTTIGTLEKGDTSWSVDLGDTTTISITNGALTSLSSSNSKLSMNPAVGNKYAVTATVKTAGQNARVLARYMDAGNEYFVGTVGQMQYNLGKRIGGNLSPLFQRINTVNAANGDVLRIEVIDNLIRGYVNGILVGSVIETDLASYRKAGFLTVSSGVVMDEFKVEEIPPQLIAFDDFNRADSSTTLGNAVTGQTWATNATWGISSNQAYGVPTVSGDHMAVIDTGVYDRYAVSADIVPIGSDSSNGIVVKASNGSNGVVIYFGTNAIQAGRISGGYTGIGSKPLALTYGQSYNLRAEVRGSNIDIYLDGVYQLTVADSVMNGNSRQGIFKNSRSTGSNNLKIDNFKVELL